MVDGHLIGRGDLIIEGAAPLGHAQPGQITLIDGERQATEPRDVSGGGRVSPRNRSRRVALPMIQVQDVHQAFAVIVAMFRPPRSRKRVGISARLAVVSPTAKIGPEVDIHPMATIGDDVEIGRGTVIHSGVRIMAGSQIGEDATIFPNAVLYEDTVVGPRCRDPRLRRVGGLWLRL